MSEEQLKRKLGSLFARRYETVRTLILERSGSGSNVRAAGVWAGRTLLETAQAEIAGNKQAGKAVKIVKNARRLGTSRRDEAVNATLKEKIGEVLLPVLDPFHRVDGCPLLSVWETSADGDLQAIHLEFKPGFLTIAVDGEDDTIDVTLTTTTGASSRPANDLIPWKRRIGQTFGWGWIGVNQQGYLDGVGLSFGSVTPQYYVSAVASSLVITQNQSVKRRSNTEPLNEPSEAIAFAKSA